MKKNNRIFKGIYVRFSKFSRYAWNRRIAALGLAVLLLPLLGGSRPWASPYPLCPGVSYVHEGGAEILIADPEKTTVLPVVTPQRSLLSLCREKRAIGGINGGFFNHKDGMMASYSKVGERCQGDPSKNRLLIDNPRLKPYLKAILDRSELRITGSGCFIERHSAPIERNFLASMQAGPRLLPTLRLREEAFLATRGKKICRDPLRAHARIPRSAVGIRGDEKVILAAFEKISIFQLREAMKGLGCREALALDGGSSTALVAGKRSFGAPIVRCAILIIPKLNPNFP